MVDEKIRENWTPNKFGEKLFVISQTWSPFRDETLLGFSSWNLIREGQIRNTTMLSYKGKSH